MKRPYLLIAAAAAAGLLVAGIGASAHSLSLSRFTHVQGVTFGDEASGARTESPEPSESPEAAPTSEPTEAPEPAPKAEPTEPPENEQGDDQNEHANTGTGTGTNTGSGDHHGGDD